MKFFATVAALAAVVPFVSAAPPWSGYKGSPKKGGWGDSSVGKDFPFKFTSTYSVIATPEQVVNNVSVSTPGEKGAIGYYNYAINSEKDLICWRITLKGVTGPYMSPAKTATHIHQAAKGLAGPPRLAFPNPEPANSGPNVDKISVGCMTGPFTTGVLANGVDTGVGFTVKQIEANPAGFFTDAHTVNKPAGVVRGQLA